MADLARNLSDELFELTVIEASELSKMLEEKWGVSAGRPMPVAVAAVRPGEAAAGRGADRVRPWCSLASFGEKKINVIKEVRAITSLGLKEAKALVERRPSRQGRRVQG